MKDGFKDEKRGVWITNPFLSACGRFQVRPETYYGKTQRELADIFGEKYFSFVSDMTRILIENPASAAHPVPQGDAKKKEEKAWNRK